MTRKITRALAHILAGRQKNLYLGNLDARRDWGFAPEYVECQWLILQQPEPGDYVVGLGESHSVREFTETAFRYAGVDLTWEGKGCGERGLVRSLNCELTGLHEGDVLVEIDPRYFRPTEVESLLANPAKARERLGWRPRVTFEELVQIMVDADMACVGLPSRREGERTLREKGFEWTRIR